MGVIVVVLPKLENAKKVKKILLEHGFQTVFACSSASSALQMVGEYSYGLVISGYRMPDMYYLDLVDCLPRDFESILLGSEETVAQVGAGILSLTMPIKAYDLVIITTAHTKVDYQMVAECGVPVFDCKNVTKHIQNRENIEVL